MDNEYHYHTTAYNDEDISFSQDHLFNIYLMPALKTAYLVI